MTRVVVVGAGNAGLCAALAASDYGADVVVLERAPKEGRGGNTAYTAGAMRVVYRNIEDLKALMPDLTDDEIASTDFGTYTTDQFYDDMARVTDYRSDPDLVEVLITRSFETLNWMRSHGVRFMPLYGRQAFKVNGSFRFWGGLTVEAAGGGPGLIDSLMAACERNGVEVQYCARAKDLLVDGRRVSGVRVIAANGSLEELQADSVVLASGGFEANAEWRARYLGSNWDLAKVRGTRYNTGDGIRMAMEIGASPAGHWSGAHAVQWDMNAPEFGDLTVGDSFQKHSYPVGVVVNNLGRRFLDEGADFRNYTYAKYGHAVLEQPGLSAWQIFDRKVAHLLRDEYRIPQVSKVSANTIDDLARKMDGVDAGQLARTIAEFNAAVDVTVPFDPNVKDGRRTVGLAVDKTNWANTISEPPFEAYHVTCGITFTFGGVRISREAQVLDTDGNPIPGLYASGELVGGLFYHNYPGGAGLTSGSVFGSIAGRQAAKGD